MALVAGGNPAFCAPQAGVVRDFLKSVPFLVAITPYLDETATMAQVVLPCGTFLESWGDCLSPYGSAVAEYGLHQPLIKAYPQVKSLGDVILALAAKLGGAVGQALPFANAQAALKARTAGLGDLAKLAKTSYRGAGQAGLRRLQPQDPQRPPGVREQHPAGPAAPLAAPAALPRPAMAACCWPPPPPCARPRAISA